MQMYKCRDCAFTFSEADRSWDSAIDSGRCPKCSEPLYDFPVPVRGHKAKSAIDEEDMYAAALAELQTGTARPGLWAKAFADSEGDENKSKALYIKLRVQQEQKAADALVAESARRKAAEFQSVLDRLLFKGYGVKRTATGWEVREPLGGRVKHDSDKSLLEYAQRHGVQPLHPGAHPATDGRVAVAPGLRDSFSSKSAERADEKSGRPGEGASATRRPYEWGSVLTWTLSLLLWGMSTPLPPSMRGLGVKVVAVNRFAFGVLWAVIGGIIVAAIKHFKRSPIPTSADASVLCLNYGDLSFSVW